MKLSIVIPVLDSHEIVRRQAIYLGNLLFQLRYIEVILVDDGSDPPIDGKFPLNFKIIKTNDKSSWSEHMATNIGVSKARGEYIFKTDIDHIITEGALDFAMRYDKPNLMIFFKRKEGKLDDKGNLIDLNIPRKPHSNTFVIKREHFLGVGGYNEYGKGIDCGGSYDLKKRLKRYGIGEGISNKIIYVWPNSPIIPTEDQYLFHNLRKTL